MKRLLMIICIFALTFVICWVCGMVIINQILCIDYMNRLAAAMSDFMSIIVAVMVVCTYIICQNMKK